MTGHGARLVFTSHAHAKHEVVVLHKFRKFCHGNAGVIKLSAFGSVKHPDGWVRQKEPFGDFSDLLDNRLLGEPFLVSKPLGRVNTKVDFEMGL